MEVQRNQNFASSLKPARQRAFFPKKISLHVSEIQLCWNESHNSNIIQSKCWKTSILLSKCQEDTDRKYKDTEIREAPYHFCADLKKRGALCKHLVHQLDPMHQRAQGHTGTGWRLPLTATVNFQHNQFMCSSIITICVQHEEDSPEEENSAGWSSSPSAMPGAKKRRRRWRWQETKRRGVKTQVNLERKSYCFQAGCWLLILYLTKAWKKKTNTRDTTRMSISELSVTFGKLNSGINE